MLTKTDIEAQIRDLQNQLKFSLVPIEQLGLSTRAYNALVRANIRTVQDIIDRDEEDGLRKIRNVGENSIDEIRRRVKEFQETYDGKTDMEEQIRGLQEQLEFGDVPIEQLDLSVRAYNGLARAGIKTLEDIINIDEERGLKRIRSLGRKSTDEIENKIKVYVKMHKNGNKKTELELLRARRDALLEIQKRIQAEKENANRLLGTYKRRKNNHYR